MLGWFGELPTCIKVERGAYVNCSAVYSENIATRMLFTISTFVRSSAVISIKTFRVLVVILEWFEFIMGGSEQTVRFESRITG